MLNRWSYHIEEINLNRFIGSYAWFLHRLSGLVLVGYVGLHMWALSAAINGPAAFNARMLSFTGPFFEIFEGLVIVAAAFHLFNGLRIIALELFNLTRFQRQLFLLAVLMTLGCVVWTGWVSVTRLMAHP